MLRAVLIVLAVATTSLFLAWGQSSAKPKSGLERRVPWTGSRVQGSPEPPPPYRTEIAFPKLKFSEPLDMTNLPEGDRLFIAERRGKIFSFPNDPAIAKADLVADVGKTVYGLALHPQFAKNGYLYVTYIVEADKTLPQGTRLVRYTTEGTPPRANLASEKVIFEWPSGGHNGGCLKFGPDGYLYIGTGDGSGIADELQTGQDVSDVLGAILRIDVDNVAPNKAYGIPKDNPLVDMTDARPEIWAYGLRQPWKFTFDPANGDLWAGEIGQDLWESVLLIERGGNYGWSVKEATHPFRPERKLGPTPILRPVLEHHHSDFRSITGGYVYHGKRLPELAGAYIYGDFDTGRVWGLRYDAKQKKVTESKELVDTNLRVVSFGQDRAGEFYLVDYMGGQIHRLTPAPRGESNAAFPRKLSETGLFASTREHTPAPGVLPYSVNSPLWGDHTVKERFLALPGTSQIAFDALTYPQPSPGAPPGWGFPDGTVLVKTFSLEMERGNPASKRRLETRILHFEQLDGSSEIGDQYWHGYTYVWNDEQTDAFLLDANGVDRTYKIQDARAPGGVVEQKYHFPSRAECTLCHTMSAKFALGVNTLQMNRDHDYNGVVANQLRTLEHIGVFSKPLPKPPEQLPKLTNHEDATQPLDKRARAYLHSNCSHCHMKWGGGNADFLLLATLPLDQLGIVNTQPGQGTFGIDKAKVLSPGHPERSLIYYRMTKTGLGRMPHVATSLVDEKAAQVVHDWIKGLKE